MAAGILTVAAETGNINGLYASIKVDPKVLDDIDAIPFVDTPLHTAASAGHTDFALEILRLKPSFGRKLNPDGQSSLHLALINDQFETVKRLIKFDKELIRVKGREGANPLHLIAEKNIKQQQREDDHLNILAEFLFSCPNSIEDLTIRDETALHIAVKTENRRAVKVILGCIRRIGREGVLPYKDEKGNNALDVAVSTSQLEIARSLRSAGALESSSPGPSLAEFLESPERPWERLFKRKFRLDRAVPMEMRNIILVVAVLIATATFQAVLSPPGGVGGPGDNHLLTNGTNINATVSSTNNVLFAANTSFINATLLVPSDDDPVKRFLFAGERVTYGGAFYSFYYCNTIAFVLSMLMIMVVLPIIGFATLHVALYSLMLSYGLSFALISPSHVYFKIFMISSYVCGVLVYLGRLAIHDILRSKRNKRLQMLERLIMNNVGQ